MDKILYNLALIHCLNFCKEKKIGCSDTRLLKRPRTFTYYLVNNKDIMVCTVTFYKNSVPTYTLNKDLIIN